MTVFLLLPCIAHAATDFSLAADPVREAVVSGDEGKFREQNWMREGYGGGIEEMRLEQTEIPGDYRVELNHRSIVRDNDYEASAEIEKKDLAYVRFHFREFSKYYDNGGGVYYPFAQLRAPELDRDLELQIGELSIEAGITPEVWPAIVLLYERRYRDGDKSRLTWGAAREGGVIRNIVPSFQEINETIDIFEVRASKVIKGFEISGEQHWELEDGHYVREEINLSTTATAADKKIRVQDQRVHAKVMTTTAGVERWSFEEKLFTGSAYHFAHLTNDELENILEMDERRRRINFANPKQIINANADNSYDAHTWVQSLMAIPWPSFSAAAKLKSEIIEREGESFYPSDTTPTVPDGIVNTTEVSHTNSHAGAWGEAIELRYTGIPRTALYNELEFEQVNNWLSEDRTSLAGQSVSNANEIFSRETITNTYRTIWTIGTRLSPWQIVDLTAHLRLNRSLNDYDDTRETQPGAATARSAFIDSMNIAMNELSQRITLKPFSWLRTSFRYQLQATDYVTRVEDQTEVETDMTSHIYSFDVSVQPVQRLLIVTGLTRQNAWVSTPAVSSTAFPVPRFDSDVTTLFLNGNYAITNEVTASGTLDFSRASNFNDFTSTGLPLGTKYHDAGLLAKIHWQLSKNIALEPQYAFYLYRTSSLTDTGNYNAHIVWLRTIFNWG